MENKNFQKLLRKIGIRAPANEQVCVCCSLHYSIDSVSIHSEASLQILILVSITCFLGDLLENPTKDQRIAAPECSCCSDVSTRSSWWWWEAKRLSNRWIPGGGRGRGGSLEWTESSGSARSAAGTQEEEPHLWPHRWVGGSHILWRVSNDSC